VPHFPGWQFIGRRWLEFRYGHSTYLVYAVSISNFILIFYNLGLKALGIEVPLWIFVLGVFFVYVPIAVLVGHQHVKRQLRIDLSRQWEQNPRVRQLFADVEELKRMVGELLERS